MSAIPAIRRSDSSDLLDSSVLIDYTRAKDPTLAALLTNLPIGICGVVRAEAICGVKGAKDRTLLNSFHQISTPETAWDAAGDHLHTLRTHGVTVPLPDAVIATFAIVNDIELWSRDSHFALAQNWLPSLKLFQEPP